MKCFYFYIQKIFVFERIETFQSLFSTENYKNENQLERIFCRREKKAFHQYNALNTVSL
jgi:hypothetical protein